MRSFVLLSLVLGLSSCGAAKQLEEKDKTITQLQTDLSGCRSDLAACQAKLPKEEPDSLGDMIDTIDAAIENKNVFIVRSEGEVRILLPNRLLFDSGSAELNEGGKGLIKSVADALKPYTDHNITVEGHTDNDAITGALLKTYKDNWALSVARARTVALLAIQSGLPPEAIVMAGRGQYDPIASNETEESKDDNRRVEIHVSAKVRANASPSYKPPEYKTRPARRGGAGGPPPPGPRK